MRGDHMEGTLLYVSKNQRQLWVIHACKLLTELIRLANAKGEQVCPRWK